MSTNKIMIIYLVVGLSIGGGGVYFIMNNQMQIMENDYENQIEQVQDAYS